MQLRNTKIGISKRQALPYKNYLDSLILSGYPADEIIGLLRDLGLSPLPQNVAADMAFTIQEYKSTFGDEENYPKGIKKMISYIRGLPGNASHLKDVFFILSDPNIKNWIQILRMGNITTDLIYVLINSRTDSVFDEIVFSDFLYYFFDIEDFTSSDKYDIMNRETDASVKDNYKLALSYNKEELLWKLGFTPDIPIEQLVKGIAAETYMRMKNSRDNNEAARLGTLGLRCVDKLKDFDQERMDEQKKTEGLNFEVLSQAPKVMKMSELDDEYDV